MKNSAPHSVSVKHIAKLANIPVTDQEATSLEAAFDETLAVVEQLQSIDVTGVQPTYQVTGLTNVLREDQVDQSRMFTQAQALANAHATHDGYFMVPQVIAQQEG